MKWDEERTEELAKLYRTMTADELALHFKTSKSSIYDKAWRLGLHKDQPSKAALTTHNKLWLMKNYPDMRNEICADYIGVSLRMENIKSLDPLLYSQLTHQKYIRTK